jgi:hypothetical protein
MPRLPRRCGKVPAQRYQQCAEMTADLERVRQGYDGVTRRMEQAALERYRQIIVLVEERRVLGRALGVDGVEADCNETLAKLETRFPMLAKHSPNSLVEPMDRALATATLESLQRRHNAAMAALEALRLEAGDQLRKRDAAKSGDASDASLRDRASALFKRKKNKDDA